MSAPDSVLPYNAQCSLWRHMQRGCAVPLITREQYLDRVPNLRNILDRVNDGGYSPSKPHGFLSAPKAHSVARFVPVFTHADTAVYFACLQCVDQNLASAAVEHTFGGWQLGGARRAMEEKEALELFGGEDSQSIDGQRFVQRVETQPVRGDPLREPIPRSLLIAAQPNGTVQTFR